MAYVHRYTHEQRQQLRAMGLDIPDPPPDLCIGMAGLATPTVRMADNLPALRLRRTLAQVAKAGDDDGHAQFLARCSNDWFLHHHLWNGGLISWAEPATAVASYPNGTKGP